MIISKKSKKFPKRKKIPRTRDGVIKLIIDEFGIEQYFCIGCRKRYTKEEMRSDKRRYYGVGSYCRKCGKIKDSTRMKNKYNEQCNKFGSKISLGKIVGRRSSGTLRYPPMDAEIPAWYLGMGLEAGYFCEIDK